MTGIFAAASSIGSASYYRIPTGFAFPFSAPILLLPSEHASHPRWWLAALAVAMIVLSIGVVAWLCCRPSLTYAYVTGVIILVALSQYIVHGLGRLGT
jgi:hypothetical protein